MFSIDLFLEIFFVDREFFFTLSFTNFNRLNYDDTRGCITRIIHSTEKHYNVDNINERESMRNYKGTNGYLSSSHERRLLNLGINQSRFARRKEKKRERQREK